MKFRTSVAAHRGSPAAMLLLAVGALVTLAACGQKGPLVLPADKPAAAAAGAAPAPAPASAAATGTGAPR